MIATGAAACFYHAPSAQPCVSLRDFLGRPAALVARHSSSRTRTAMLDRSAELRAAGAGEAAGPAAAALEALPPLAAGLEVHHLTEAQREQATNDILRAFLAASINRSSSGGSGSAAGGSSSWCGGVGGDAPPRQRGLQGQVVEHLTAGGFDEALLQSVPTHTLNWAIKVLGEQQHPVLAEQLYHWMRVTGRANEHSFVKLCEACGAARQPWRAFHAWRTTRRVPQARHIVGSHAGAALVLAYRSTADHQAALQALEDLQRRGVALTRHAYNAAVRVCADAGAADDALRLLAALRCAAAGQAQEAEQPAQQGQPGGGQQQGQQAQQPGQRTQRRQGQQAQPPSGELHTDCRSYSAALAAVAAAGKWNRAPQLHRWMEEDGVVPDAPLATQLLAAYAAGGQAGAAQGVFDGLPSAGVRPNRSHWNALLLAYAEAADGAGCAATYRAMVSTAVQPDGYTLTALLRAAYLLQGGLPAVQAVRAEGRKHRVPMSLRLGTAVLACLRHVRPAGSPGAAALAQLRPARVARKDRRRQRRRQQGCGQAGSGAAATAMTAAAECVAAAAPPAAASPAEPTAAAAAAAAAAAVGPLSVLAGAVAAVHTSAAQEPAGAGQDHSAACLAEATALFAELRAAAAAGGQPLDVRAYNALLAVQLAAGDHDGVLRTFQQLEEEEQLMPDGGTLAAVIAACQEAGWTEREAQYRRLLESSRLLGALGGRRACRSSGPSLVDDGSV
ncbi:hypothetical protein ABPG75_004983 [Micractinium tetrahymenae]